MGKKPTLTEKQRKFAYELVTNEGRITATEAAKRAGYGSPRERAYELQNPRKHPLVVKYIGEIRDELQKKYDITFQRHISELAKIRDQARAYAKDMEKVVAFYMNEAIRSDRTTVYNAIKDAWHPKLAELIRRL